jgi:hypothetical protein
MTLPDNPVRLAFEMKTLFAVLVCMAFLSGQAMGFPYAP